MENKFFYAFYEAKSLACPLDCFLKATGGYFVQQKLTLGF